MKKLNIGCGNDYKEGWVNIDNDNNRKVDINFDLNKIPYPLQYGTFDYILASHIIEHLDNPKEIMKELKILLKQDGKIEIVVPHFTNPMAYTPLHKNFYNWNSIEDISLSNGFKLISKQILFTPKYKFMEWFANKFPVFYENTPLRIFPAKEIRVLMYND